MVQTASLLPPVQAPRLSQLLPTVKCSSCSQPVPLSDLSDHVCSPPPPLPSAPLPPKSPASPKPPPSFLSQRLRLQNLVPRANTPPRKSSLDTGAQAPASPHLPPVDYFHRQPPPVGTPRKISLALPPTAPPRTPSPAANASAPRDRQSQLTLASAPSLERIRSPSIARRPSCPGSDAPIPSEVGSRHSIAERSRAPSLVRKERPPPPQQLPVPVSILRSSTASSGPSLPASLQPRASSQRTRTPSASSSLACPPMDILRPSFGPSRRPSTDSQQPSVDRHAASSVPLLSSSPGQLAAGSTVPFPSLPVQLTKPLAHPPVMQPPPPPPISLPRSPVPESERDIDTKCGGVAGMAGVGRRGFAAAARAAMMATSLSNPHHHAMAPSVDGRRANVPRYLDINATMGHVFRGESYLPFLFSRLWWVQSHVLACLWHLVDVSACTSHLQPFRIHPCTHIVRDSMTDNLSFSFWNSTPFPQFWLYALPSITFPIADISCSGRYSN